VKQHTWVVRCLICCLLWGIRLMQVTRHLLRHHVIPYLAWPLGWLRSHRQVVAVWPDGAVPLGPRVALFCHFDAHGAVRVDVLRYLAALREAGFSIIAVSNGGALQPLAMTHLQTVCAAVLVRRNVGYDFCAWREALERFDVPRSDTELVLLANDSVYGPLHSLTPILARVMAGGADVWGLTDSNQIRFHLQSYFLVAGAAAIRSDAWRRFWQSVRPVPSKSMMIRRYEVGLTQCLSRAGLRCEALWPVATLCQPDRATARVNPTHHLWRQLLDAGFPFIKRELVRDNPAGIADAAEWRQAVRAIDGARLYEIEQDLRRASG
jgi:lipopolysaccharide biosynthesis protein